MKQLIIDFPEQIRIALKRCSEHGLQQVNTPFQNVLLCGLGGSGIGGDFARELLSSELSVPLIVNRTYHLPNFASDKTLVVLSSYSGNTEEVLSVAAQLRTKNLPAVVITSGGKLRQFANEMQWPCMELPAGFPPRSCIGYSTVSLMHILEKALLIGNTYIERLTQIATELEQQQEKISSLAMQLALQLNGKIVIAYSEERNESVLIRLKQQLNENAKVHCWYNVVPEMNHNELVGWRKSSNDIATVVFRTSLEHSRNQHRFRFYLEEMKAQQRTIHIVHAEGSDRFSQHFYMIHFCDWLSLHLADLGGYDAMEIDVLVRLKDYLSQIE